MVVSGDVGLGLVPEISNHVNSKCVMAVPYVSHASHALAFELAVIELLNGSPQIGGILELNEAVILSAEI